VNGKIAHVVIIVQENHTFDNYFGRFPGAEGDSSLPHCVDPGQVTPPHGHAAWLERAEKAARCQYDESDLPDYWALARQFTLCDRYFSEVAGPSTPNHLMLLTADSPIVDNPTDGGRGAPNPPFDLPSLPAALEKAGLSWREYGGYNHAYKFISGLKDSPFNLPAERFEADARDGRLPAVSWVYAPAGLSEHPPEPVANGMHWALAQVKAVVKGGLWPECAVFLTWDDWGGWFDHVEPPQVESWRDGSQFRYGSRVPCLVLGPYARPGYVSRPTHSHVSLLRFCEITFGLQPLTARDAAADAMLDCFDFERAPAPPPLL
jgi:phospholipase C